MILAVAAAAALMSQAGGAQPARPERARLNDYFSANDYPRAAMHRRAEGTSAFRLEIGADGTITRCSITSSSGDAALDEATCSVLRARARYQPARDNRGRPVPGTDEGRVTWRLPAPRFSPHRAVSTLRTDGAGTLTCTVTTNGAVERDIAPGQCGALSDGGVERTLRALRRPAEVSLVFATGPTSPDLQSVAADEASLGRLQYDLVAEYDIAPDGRVTGCRSIRRNIAEDSAFHNIAEMCVSLPADAPPMFEASTDGAPRRAIHRMATYLKGEGLSGIDPDGRPRANLNSYFSADDYPAAALRTGAEGTVHFRLEINAEGRVSRCIIAQSSGNEALDAKTCEVMISRARYQPARNAAGEPTTGTDEGRVTWRLPAAEARPFQLVRAPARLVISFATDGRGSLTCGMQLNGAAVGEEAEQFCAPFVARAAAGRFGQPGNTTLVQDYSVGLSGELPPRADLDRRGLLLEQTARLTVGHDGRVTDCRLIQTDHQGSLEVWLRGFHICTFPGLGGRLFPAVPAGSAPRTALLRRDLYFRSGGPSGN